MTDPLAQAEHALEQALEAVHEAEALSPVAELVNAHLTASATPRYLDMGPGYLGPTAINGT